MVSNGVAGSLRLLRVSVLLAVVAPLGGVALAAPRAVAAKGWSQDVLPATGEDKFHAAACETLESRMAKQLQAIKAIRADIVVRASAPPGTVVGLLQSLAGAPAENADVAAARVRLGREEKAARHLNTLLQAAECATVDLDAVFNAAETAARDAKLQAPLQSNDLMSLPPQPK